MWNNAMMPIDAVEQGAQSPFVDEMVEVDLFLPGWQAAALEEAAHSRGLTTGQMLRGMINEYFGRFASRPPWDRS